jgi:hypothetical protein
MSAVVLSMCSPYVKEKIQACRPYVMPYATPIASICISLRNAPHDAPCCLERTCIAMKHTNIHVSCTCAQTCHIAHRPGIEEHKTPTPTYL